MRGDVSFLGRYQGISGLDADIANPSKLTDAVEKIPDLAGFPFEGMVLGVRVILSIGKRTWVSASSLIWTSRRKICSCRSASSILIDSSAWRQRSGFHSIWPHETQSRIVKLHA